MVSEKGHGRLEINQADSSLYVQIYSKLSATLSQIFHREAQEATQSIKAWHPWAATEPTQTQPLPFFSQVNFIWTARSSSGGEKVGEGGRRVTVRPTATPRELYYRRLAP